MERGKYIEWITGLRKARQLHTTVENRLVEILAKATPDFHPINEPVGLAGGRNDLMLFEFSGQKVLFEVFASANQVSRDLRILDKTEADCKIAVVIDKDVDPRVFEQFLRKNPEDNYPFIFVGELFAESPIECVLKLRQLILGDEEAKFQRVLLYKLSAPDFIELCQQEGIDILSESDVESGTVTFQKVFLIVIAAKLRELGVNQERLLELLRWMSSTGFVRFVVMKVSIGFNTFLYTDMGGNKAVYSDDELLDWLRVSHTFSKPYILLSLNAVIYEILDNYFQREDGAEIDRSVRFTVGHSLMYKHSDGWEVRFYIPRNTKLIQVYRPMKPMNMEKEEVTTEEYQAMMEFF